MDLPSERLSIDRHDRDAIGLRYVYAVVSRRSGGISVGINLNPNHACNWHCAYCQVPGLVRGPAPAIDEARLDRELRGFLDELLKGDFMERRVPPASRRLGDIAISGNGEPTGSRQFAAIVDLIAHVMHDLGLAGRIPLVLITNGSHVSDPAVQQGLRTIARLSGEAWIKADSATPEGILRINGIHDDAGRLEARIETCARLCKTWIQTCLLRWDGACPSEAEQTAYLDLLTGLVSRHVPIAGIRLYGIARAPQQPEAEHIGRLDPAWMQAFADRITTRTGLVVLLTP